MAKQKSIQKPARAASVAQLPMWERKRFFEWLVFLFAFFLFANSIPNDYNMDDELVTINHRLTSKGISAIPEIFTSPYYQDESGYAYEYRPIVLTSFAIEHEVFGDNPHVSHFFNVLLYALCCLLLLHVLSVLFKDYSILISVAITLVFIAHPAHTEVVCSIKNRDEILGLIFSLLTLFATLKAIQLKKVWIWMLIPILFLLALMSKVTVISFAVIIPFAIILFTESRLKTTLLINFLLLAPVFFILSINGNAQRISIVLGVTSTVLLFHLIIHFKTTLANVGLFFSTTRSRLFENKTSSVPNSSYNNNFDVKLLFVGVIPDKKLFTIQPFLITFSLAFVYLYGEIYYRSYFLLLPFVALMLLALKGEHRISWWAKCMILLSLSINTSQLRIPSDFLYIRLVLTLLSYQLILGDRSLFFPTLLAFSFFSYFDFYRYQEIAIVYPIIILIVLLNRFTRIVGILGILYLLGLSIYSLLIHNTLFVYELLVPFVITSMIIVVHTKKGNNLLISALFLLTVIAVVSFHLRPAKTKPLPYYQSPSGIIAVGNTINPGIISVRQDRPLEYLEQCVNKSSPLSIQIGTSLEIVFHYLYKVILPYRMSYYYGYKFIKPQKIQETIPLISLLSLLTLLALAIVFAKKEPIISIGIFIYLVPIVVFSNYLAPVPGMLADRFLLIPSLGWSFVLISVCQKLFNWNGKLSNLSLSAKATFGTIIVLYSTLSFSRNMNWKDPITLFKNDIQYVDNSAQAHNLLALRLMKSSYEISNPAEQLIIREDALYHFKKSIAIYPMYFNTNYDLGRTFIILNQPDSAINALKDALRLNPSFTDLYLTIGELLVRQHRLEEAIPLYESLIRFEPTKFAGYDRLSYLYFLQKKYSLAIEINKKAILKIPNDIQPYLTIGKIYNSLNNQDSARVWVQKSLIINPEDIGAQNFLKSLQK